MRENEETDSAVKVWEVWDDAGVENESNLRREWDSPRWKEANVPRRGRSRKKRCTHKGSCEGEEKRGTMETPDTTDINDDEWKRIEVWERREDDNNQLAILQKRDRKMARDEMREMKGDKDGESTVV